MHRSRGLNWARFVFACSIAVGSAGIAAAGQHGGGHGHDGHHSEGRRGGSHGADSRHGEGHYGRGRGADGRHGKGHHSLGHGADDRHAKGHHRGSGKTAPSGHRSGFIRSLQVDLDAASTGATAASAVPYVGVRQVVDLQPILQPLAENAGVAPYAVVRLSLDPPFALLPLIESRNSSGESPIDALPGVPAGVVRACRDAIASAAAPFGATGVHVSSAGFVHQLSLDSLSAPVEVSIDYARQGGVETREAVINCELTMTGSVIGLK